MLRPPPPADLKPSHTAGQLTGAPPAELGPVRYKRIIQILVSGIIIGTVALFLITGYYKARRPAYAADCMGRLRVLAQAFEMYGSDNEQLAPPAAEWRWAISGYADEVGGFASGALTRPRGFSSPMRCLANQTTTPISYFYASPVELGQGPLLGGDPLAPLLVDEVHHPKALMLRQDSSCAQVGASEWIRARDETWEIARRQDWRNTFAYTSTRRQAQPTPPETGEGVTASTAPAAPS